MPVGGLRKETKAKLSHAEVRLGERRGRGQSLAYVKTVKRAKRLCDMSGEMEEGVETWKACRGLGGRREGGERRGVRGDTKMK